MNRNNNLKLNENIVVDFELARFERLIEERESYEKQFFSLEPPADEIEYYISQYEKYEISYVPENFEFELDNPFEFEDYLLELRDEKLILEREIYESFYFSDVSLAENDIISHQIESLDDEEFIPDYEDYVPDYDDYIYDSYEEDMFYHLYYLKKESLNPPSCDCPYCDYMPYDDGLCDTLACYDYPEGPNENLEGIKFY